MSTIPPPPTSIPLKVCQTALSARRSPRPALADPAFWWRIALWGRYTQFSTGDRATMRRAALQQRFTLGRDLELLVDWSGVEGHREAAPGAGDLF